MRFDSFVFAGLFLPVVLTLFWLSPDDRYKRTILLGSSLVFYGYWNPSYLILLIGMVGVAWLCARLAEHTPASWPLWTAAFLLLGTLGLFKYSAFASLVARDLGLADHGGSPALVLALPLGISFIAFQALGYVIDVHRREFPAEPRFGVVLLFKAFFPQLIAGPICRAHQLMPQLRGHFAFSWDRLLSGAAIFALGLFLKSVFADSLAPHVDRLFDDGTVRTAYHSWAAAYGFAGQIYSDFWGYSTMAVGLARMFGIDLPINFTLPYLSRSIREFWTRWHITLSHWLRDYLYKPLGGSHRGPIRTMVALLITMLLGGLWHGAHYTFLLWGLLHGLVLSLEHAVGRDTRERDPSAQLTLPAVLSQAGGWIYTMGTVLVGWILFRAATVGQALDMIASLGIFTGEKTVSPSVLPVTLLTLALLVLQIPIQAAITAFREGRVPADVSLASAFSMVWLSIVLGAPDTYPFVYFQF